MKATFNRSGTHGSEAKQRNYTLSLQSLEVSTKPPLLLTFSAELKNVLKSYQKRSLKTSSTVMTIERDQQIHCNQIKGQISFTKEEIVFRNTSMLNIVKCRSALTYSTWLSLAENNIEHHASILRLTKALCIICGLQSGRSTTKYGTQPRHYLSI